jgi:DNA polymerase III subunit gamma/tau
MTDESPGLGLDLPDEPQSLDTPYRVLARKYRPQTFDQLIGQDAMVKTLANAIERDRIAHAFLLTGVRGVGKTSTARLIAKALNCIGPDGQGQPTIQPCGTCEHCLAIAQGRHIDVIEMDAASHTGVDDIREIIDAVRYASVSARYKIYIIDEVHMLSKNAFNALLKTLEEPPQHVKFLFATTEVNKVPLTVLSRTQRFDLRRIDPEKLVAHFAEVARLEGVEAETDALAMIARAAEGSARDGLSILDQAIAHGSGTVTATLVRDMLGLADRGRIRDLLELILKGDSAGALTAMDEADALGMDPASLLRGLMEALHSATRAKAGAQAQALLSAEQREFAEMLADRLSWAQIHRLWQMLLKGVSDVTVAPDPREAAVMAVLRLIHSADLPDPAAILEQLASGKGASAQPVAAESAAAKPAPGKPAAKSAAAAPAAQLPADFMAMIQSLETRGRHQLATQLHDQVGLVRYDPPELVVKPLRPVGTDWPRELGAALKEVTGTNWAVSISDEGAQASLGELEKMAEEQVRTQVLQDPAVKAALDAFPEAELESYSTTKG